MRQVVSCRGSAADVFDGVFQTKYKQSGLKSLAQSAYSQLPQTTQTLLAKSVSELQSEVRTERPEPNRGHGGASRAALTATVLEQPVAGEKHFLR